MAVSGSVLPRRSGGGSATSLLVLWPEVGGVTRRRTDEDSVVDGLVEAQRVTVEGDGGSMAIGGVTVLGLPPLTPVFSYSIVSPFQNKTRPFLNQSPTFFSFLKTHQNEVVLEWVFF